MEGANFIKETGEEDERNRVEELQTQWVYDNNEEHVV